MTAIAATSAADVTADPDRTAAPSIPDSPTVSSDSGGPAPSITLADGSEYLLVDPGDLIIGANVRTNPDLDKDFKGFTCDIGKRGVRAPIITRRNDAGELVVVEGQMRVLAAVKTGRPLVRVLVEPGPVSDDPASEAERIINQLGDNFHRTANSHADEVRATQQLLDLGLTARAIEQQRSIPRTRVTTLVAVARSAAAAEAVTSGIADLTQAAVLAEFDGDDDAIAQLLDCARTDPKRFGQVAQWLRDDREEARLCQQARDRLAEQGVTVIDRPDGLFGGRIRRLEDLRATPKTKPGTALSVKRHEKCPGHAAYLDYWGSRLEKDRVQVVYVCTDFRQHGHAERYASADEVAMSGQRTGAMSEEEKAYRRTVIANGKAWDSATTFRRKWLKEFAARKTALKDAHVWIAQMLAQGGPELRQAMDDDHTLAVELLGLAAKPGRSRYARHISHPIADAAAKATPGRATMITLVMLLAALESSTDRRHTWERPSRDQIAYFTQLAAYDYPLADVEQLVLTHAAASSDTASGSQPQDSTASTDPSATADPPPGSASNVADAGLGPDTSGEGTAPAPDAAGAATDQSTVVDPPGGETDPDGVRDANLAA
jgi:ParB family chromosome partitioning protein